MPPADKIDDQTLLRVICYGPARSKKTWWAYKFAELGFNVHLFDADNGWEILHQTGLSQEQKARVNIIPIVDTDVPVSCVFWTYLLRRRKLLWDEQAKNLQMIEANVNHAHPHWLFDLSKLSTNDVVICDSWTAIVTSLYQQYFNETGTDLFDVSNADNRDKRGEFGWAGGIASFILNQIAALPCHVVLIGHETTWEKRSQKVVNGRKQEVIEDVRTQMVSTSGPHARDIIRRFGNAFHFIIKHSGNIEIDVQIDPKTDAGSRLVAPGRYAWADLSPSKLCELGRVKLPEGASTSRAVTYLPAGSDFTFEEIGLGFKKPSAVIGNSSAKAASVAVDKPQTKPNPFAKGGK